MALSDMNEEDFAEFKKLQQDYELAVRLGEHLKYIYQGVNDNSLEECAWYDLRSFVMYLEDKYNGEVT